MRVAQFSEFGGPQALRLEEVTAPSPGPDEVLIKVSAVGLNFFDTLLLRNKYQVSPPLPFSTGAEIAGTVEGLGVNVSDLEKRFKAGDEVTPESLREKGLATRRHPVKVLGNGDISAKLTVRAHAFSASAKEKIEAAGGSCEEIAPGAR